MYYPFGLEINATATAAASENRYKFNGIEQVSDFGVNLSMAFYRGYDAATGRWLQVDPKASWRESGYVGMGNNPIRYSDVLGDTVRITKSITDNKMLNAAFSLFAASKSGNNFLSNYAAKGQTFGGKTFEKDGKYNNTASNY
jgi:RHS repeat-associated protein